MFLISRFVSLKAKFLFCVVLFNLFLSGNILFSTELNLDLFSLFFDVLTFVCIFFDIDCLESFFLFSF